MHGESGDTNCMCVNQVLSKMLLLISQYASEDVYNMDEIGLFYQVQSNNTLAQGKVKKRKIKKDRVTLALATPPY